MEAERWRLSFCVGVESAESPGFLNSTWALLKLSPCVVLQEFAGEDTTDLFLEEREAVLRQAQEEKHKLQLSVPGILNPHELPEEMCD